MDKEKTLPDPIVKEQARVHPVSSRKLEAIEDIVLRDTRNLTQWETEEDISPLRDTSQESLFPSKKLTSVSNLSRYLPKPLLERIKQKCSDNLEVTTKIGSVSRVIQA